MSLSDLDFQAIRERCDKATEGPWRAENIGYATLYRAESFVEPAIAAFWQADSANANFIAHARQDLPILLDEVARLRKENERLIFELGDARHELAHLMMRTKGATP